MMRTFPYIHIVTVRQRSIEPVNGRDSEAENAFVVDVLSVLRSLLMLGRDDDDEHTRRPSPVSDDAVKTVTPNHAQHLTTLNLIHAARSATAPLCALFSASKSLHTVRLSGDCITSDCLHALSSSPSCATLKSLHLEDAYGVSTPAYMNLFTHTPQLRHIELIHCNNVNDDTMSAIAASCHELESLRMEYDIDVSDEGVLALSEGCTRLQHIVIQQVRQVTHASLGPLFSACRSLTVVRLGTVSDVSLHTLAGAALQSLTFGTSSSNVATTGFEQVCRSASSTRHPHSPPCISTHQMRNMSNTLRRISHQHSPTSCSPHFLRCMIHRCCVLPRNARC